MEKKYEVLFTAADIGTCHLKNRFIMCPMEGTAMINWMYGNGYDEKVHDLFIDRAKDGVGLIIPGAVPVASFTGHQWLYRHQEAFAGVKEMMEEIHQYGTKVFFQLTAGFGRNLTMMKPVYDDYEKLNPLINLDATHASADDGMPNIWIRDFKTKALTAEEIHEIVNAMAETAWLCKENGVDGIDVHAVHEGYLLDQFALAYTNHRQDEYGGTLENRLRFACEVVKAIKERCGQDYPVILRYSVTSKTRGLNQGIIPQDHSSDEIGRTMEESKKAIRILTEAGYDAFNADNGTYDAWYYAHPPVYMPLNCNLDDCMEISQYTDKPVICAGRMQLEEASEAIEKDKIQFVGIARQFLCDPRYLTKIREGKEEDVIPCISCHLGCLPVGMWKNSGCVVNPEEPTGVCALNPYSRNEKKYGCTETKERKSVAVIGGGIAGMETALQADRRGHKVTLYEKGSILGGVFQQAASFSFKEKDRDLIRYYVTQIAKSDIAVHMNTDITRLKELKADEIIIATGAASAGRLSVPGSERTVSALDYLKGNMSGGNKVVIIGGGLTGCEIAYELALQGKEPVIVELQDDILKVPGSCMANTSYLRDAFDYYKVPVYTSAEVIKIQPNYVEIRNEKKEKVYLDADVVVASIGYRNGNPFIKEEQEHIHTVGDAYSIGNLKSAIWRANDIAITL